MADVSQIRLPNGSVYDLIDEKSGYITAEYIEDKTDYEIPVSRVGEIVVGETAIGTDSTNFPTSKAVVDYVDERVVQEIAAIDFDPGVTGVKVNGTSLSIVDGVVNIPGFDIHARQSGLFTDELFSLIGSNFTNISNSIPTSTSQLTNDSGFITASDIPAETDPTVPAWAKASTKPTYTAVEVGALPSSTVITDEKLKVNQTSDNGTYYPILTSNSTEAQTKLRYSGLNFVMESYEANLRIGYASISTPRMGKLSLAKATYYTTIVPSNNGQSNTITLPNKTGTVALLDDIPTVPTNISSFTNDSGYLTASDIASVMTYKGTKANYAALPSTGNTTGDVWHLTDTGAEWAWDGSTWQELGTAIDLSGYATKATTLAGYGITDAKIQNGTITLGSNTITPLTSFTETDPTVPSWAKASSKPSYSLTEISGTDDLRVIEGLTGTTGLLKKTAANTWTLDTNTYLTSYTETDPTVPSWAKASSKPSYGLTEISGTDDLRAIEALTGTSGLLKKTAANTWTLDTNTYLTSYTETDPVFSASAAAGITSANISNWNNKSSTDEKVKLAPINENVSYYPILTSGDTISTASTKFADLYGISYSVGGEVSGLVLGNNTSTTESTGRQGRLTIYGTGTFFSRFIVGTLTANSVLTLPNKTGTVALTSDIPTVPTKVSDLTNDSGFISSYTETDPIFSASAAAGITSTDISNWNAKTSNTGTITSVKTTAGQHTTINVTSGAANFNVPTHTSHLTNDSGFLTLATLPIYDGTVEDGDL